MWYKCSPIITLCVPLRKCCWGLCIFLFLLGKIHSVAAIEESVTTTVAYNMKSSAGNQVTPILMHLQTQIFKASMIQNTTYKQKAFYALLSLSEAQIFHGSCHSTSHHIHWWIPHVGTHRTSLLCNKLQYFSAMNSTAEYIDKIQLSRREEHIHFIESREMWHQCVDVLYIN